MRISNLNYKIYNGKILKDILKNSRIFILVVLFCAGLLLGALSLNNNYEITEKIDEITESLLVLKKEGDISEIFFSSLISNFIFILISIFLGFSLVGYPFIWWIPLVKGLGIGILTGYLYSYFSFKGVGYSLIIIYPAMIVSTFALILSCNDSIIYSKNAFMKSIKGRGEFEKDETKIYIIRNIIYLLIVIVSSVADTLLAKIFSNLFKI